MRRFVGKLLAASLLASIACDAGGARKVTAGDCVKVRDHRAALVVERAAGQLDEAEKAAHSENISESAGQAFVKRCLDEMTVASLECALAARSIEEIDRCKGARGE